MGEIPTYVPRADQELETNRYKEVEVAETLDLLVSDLRALKEEKDPQARQEIEQHLATQLRKAHINIVEAMVEGCADEKSIFHDLPESAVIAMMENFFHTYGEGGEREREFLLEDLVSTRCFFPEARIEDSYALQERDYLGDKILRVAPDLYRKYPNEIMTLMGEDLGEHLYLVRWDTRVETAIRVSADPMLPDRLFPVKLDDIEESFGERLEQAARDLESENPSEALRMLDLLHLIADHADASFWLFGASEISRGIRDRIKEFSQKTDNYFLSKKSAFLVEQDDFTEGFTTKELRKMLDGRKDWVEAQGIDPTPEQMQDREFLREVLLENPEMFRFLAVAQKFRKEKQALRDPSLPTKIALPLDPRSDYFLRRVAKGKVGIFLEDRQLYGYVDEAMVQEGARIPRSAMTPVVETEGLFSAQMDSKTQQSLLIDLYHLHHLEMRETIERDFGFKYEELTLAEQLWFLEFLQDKKKDEIAPIAEFIKTFGADGLRAFVALEHDAGAAEDIFAIAEKLPVEQARAVFQKYAKLSETARHADEQVQQFFTRPELGQEGMERRATAEMMWRAGGLLHAFAQAGESSPEELQSKLEAIKEDVVLFASLFKTAYETHGGALDFAEVAGMQFEERPAQFTADEVSQMLEIAGRNYADTPLLSGVLKGLRGAIGKENNRFCVLKKDGRVVSFDRFETRRENIDEEPGIIEFASFNTDPAYQRSDIGRAMMRKTLEMKARENIIVAQTDPMSPIASFYVEQAGFVVTGIEEYKGTGVYVFDIERDDRKTYAREGKSLELGSTPQEVAQSVRLSFERGDVLVRYYKQAEMFIGVTQKKMD